MSDKVYESKSLDKLTPYELDCIFFIMKECSVIVDKAMSNLSTITSISYYDRIMEIKDTKIKEALHQIKYIVERSEASTDK